MRTHCSRWGRLDQLPVVWRGSVTGACTAANMTCLLGALQDDTGFSLYTSDERELLCEDDEVLKWLQRKVEQALLSRQA